MCVVPHPHMLDSVIKYCEIDFGQVQLFCRLKRV